jgi:hypothetical protein
MFLMLTACGGPECPPGEQCEDDEPVNNYQDPTGLLDIRCESESIEQGVRFQFDLSAETISFAVVPLSLRGDEVRPLTLWLPDNVSGAEFGGDYQFFDNNWQLLGDISPVFFPGAPQFSSLLSYGGGSYGLDVMTLDPAPCYYLLQEDTPGNQLNLAIYLVSASGIDADSAPEDVDLLTVLGTVEEIFESGGFHITDVQFIDVSEEQRIRYEYIRDLDALHELMRISAPRGDSTSDLMALNLFIVRDILLQEAPGAMGYSSGLPGVPGLHGVKGSGLVFSSVLLGVDNKSLGQTIAHEIGHFMGLRHTTEANGDVDPIEDTPFCEEISLASSCPDVLNLMFPFKVEDREQWELSEGQGQVLGWSPHSN